MAKNKEFQEHCSFCGINAEMAVALFQGLDNSFICDECIKTCYKIIEEKDSQKLNKEKKDFILPKPQELKDYLDKYVIGQNHAKKVLSVSVYNHYKRIFLKDKVDNNIEIQKSNILILGPSGTGKTLLAETLARKLKVPFAIADATTVTEAGYVGDDVENILLRLIQNADGDVKLAEKGIIFIDELDKIARKSENTSITRDVSGEGVQQALLKIIEGTVAHVPPNGGRKHPNQALVEINTKNILFICGGAFVGIENLIQERMNKSSIGFEAEVKNSKNLDLAKIYEELQPDDLVKFGLIPELIGRLPVHVGLNNLDKDALIQIITTPENSILKQYSAMLKLDEVELEFQESAIEAIAEMSITRKTGARGIRAIFEKLMLDIMFEIPSYKEKIKVIVTKNNVIKNTKPKIKILDNKKSA